MDPLFIEELLTYLQARAEHDDLNSERSGEE
jgi:hypothetical protein